MDNFLTGSEAGDILQTDEFKSWKLHFRKAGIGKQQDRQVVEAIRGDYIQWIDPASAPAPLIVYFNKLHSLMRFVNKSLYLSLKEFEIHMTIYPAGTFYKRHLDQFRSDDHRKLSVICYLNEEWQPEHGGQLRMHLPEGPIDVLPLSGRLVCFRSDMIEHEVLPATRERWSLTGWMLDREIL